MKDKNVNVTIEYGTENLKNIISKILENEFTNILLNNKDNLLDERENKNE